MKAVVAEARIPGGMWRLLCLSGALLGCVAPVRSQEGDRSPLPEGKGKEIVQRVCSQCHGIGLFRGRGEAREGWDWTVHRMLGYGAPLKPEEVQVAIDYLAMAIPGPPRPVGKVIPGSVEATIKEWDTPTHGERVRDPLVAPDGYIYYAGQFKDKVGQFDPKTGKIKEWALRPGAGPHGLAADYEGNIWFTAQSAGYLGKLNPKTGQITEYPMPIPHATPHTPLFDRQRTTLFFTLETGNSFGRMNLKTGEIKLVPSPTPDSRPYGMVIDSKGVPFYAEFNSNKLARVDPETMEIKEYELPHKDSRVRRIAITPDDIIWYADYDRGYLGRFDPKTVQFKEWLSPSGPHSLPYAIAATRGAIWYNEAGANPNTIVRFDPKSEKFQAWVLPSGPGSVRNMMPAPDGDLWIANAAADKLGKVEIRK